MSYTIEDLHSLAGPHDGKSLKTLENLTGKYLQVHWSEGGTSEFDPSINEISRAKIDAARELWGKCWLGKVNLYDDQRGKRYRLTPYTGQLVYNFEYSFIVPVNSRELCKLIKERDRAPYTGTREDFSRVEEIHAQIEKLGGILLIWS